MQQKTVAILGATGMLGNALYKELKDRYRLILAVRDPAKIALLEKSYGAARGHRVVPFDAALAYQDFIEKRGYESVHLRLLFESLKDADCVLNAIGITIPYALENPALTFFVNGVLPHLLAARLGVKLIHITTDCVYNGRDGFPYSEESPKSPVDVYGVSKSLGEPIQCLTLRTSVIGRELSGFTGLLEWFRQQKGKTVKGFANHFWNGITTRQFAKVCDALISDPQKFPRTGLYHIFSEAVSKYDMLLAFREKFGVDCEVMPEYENKLNRTLATVHGFNAALKIPSFRQMVREI